MIAAARHGRVAYGGGATRPVVSELVENSTRRGAVATSPTSALPRIARNETTEAPVVFRPALQLEGAVHGVTQFEQVMLVDWRGVR